MNDILLWNLMLTFDRDVAYPGEELDARALVINPNIVPIYLGKAYWKFSCHPNDFPKVIEINKIILPNTPTNVSNYKLIVPNILESQYDVEVSFDTLLWSPLSKTWVNFGRIVPDRKQSFSIIHTPRFRAFISRSNKQKDCPVVETILRIIKQWGFSTHTVGINECEYDINNAPERIKSEIGKADCIFAIASPRDYVALSKFRTLTWLDNEVAIAFAYSKPIILVAQDNILLDGLIATNKIPTIKYSLENFDTFLGILNYSMPIIRQHLSTVSYLNMLNNAIKAIENIRTESFASGMAVQKQLMNERKYLLGN